MSDDNSLPSPSAGMSERWKIFALVMLSNPSGAIGVLLPTFLDGFVARGFSTASAAQFVAIDTSAAALVSLCAPLFIARVNLRQLGIVGIGLAIAGQLLSIVVESAPLLMLCRGLTGGGVALLGAASMATISGIAAPQRIFAFGVASNQVTSIVLLALIGWRAHQAPTSAAFMVMAIFLAITFVFTGALARRSTSGSAGVQAVATVATAAGATVFGLIGIFCIAAGFGAVWPVVGQIGHMLGTDSETLSRIYVLGAVGGMLGGGFSAFIATRFGRVMPLVFGGVGMCLSFILVPSPFLAPAAIMSMFFFAFNLPYFLGLQAMLDATGRLAVFASAVMILGIASGQVAASAVSRAVGLPAAAFLGGGLVAIAMLSMVVAVKQLMRQAAK